MRWLRILVVALLALLPPTAGLGRASGEEYALPSALATRSLLLDVARAGERLVAMGAWGHVLLSDDAGRTWRQAESVPTRVTLTALQFVDAQEGWAVGHDAVILHTSDGGETWEVQHAAPEEDAPLLSVWFGDARRGIAVGAFGLILETSDGGRTWNRRAISEHSEEDYHLNHIFAGPADALFIAAEFGWVFRSRDKGSTWEAQNPPYQGSFWGGLAVGDAILVFGMRGHVFRSDDLGETWQEVPSGTDQSLQNATRLQDGAIVLVGLGGVVLTSRDSGRTFTARIEADRRGIAAATQAADGALLLFGEAGVKTR